MQLNGTITHSANMHTDQSRRLFVPMTAVKDGTAAICYGGGYSCAKLNDAELSKGLATADVPANFISTASVVPFVIGEANGDIRFDVSVRYSANGETYDTHVDAYGMTTATLVGSQMTELAPLVLGDLALGDLIGMTFRRDGTDVLDTLVGAVYALGFVFKYVADQ